MKRIALGSLRERLGERLPGLRESAGRVGELVSLGFDPNTPDDTSKVLIRNVRGQPLAIALCSNSVAPRLAERGARLADASRNLLGERLGSVILEPLLIGEIEGLTFVVLPWYRSLATSRWAWSIQRLWLRPIALRWLREATRVAAAAHRGAAASCHDFRTALSYLSGLDLEDTIRRGLDRSLTRLERGLWKPSHTLDHNDLWRSNFLRARSPVHDGRSAFPFVIIDWLGANPKGYGIYDLIRLASSMQLGRVSLRREIEEHCDALGCDPVDAGGHLLASLGRLGRDREHFPEDRFFRLVDWSWAILESAQGERR